MSDNKPEHGTICGIRPLNNDLHRGDQPQTGFRVEGALSKNNEAQLGTAGIGVHAEAGRGGVLAEGGADVALYKDEDLELVKGYADAGVGAGAGGIKAKAGAGVDAVNKTWDVNDDWEVNARVGLNVDTGVEIGTGGIEVSFLGFGISLGRKTGFSTPFGGASAAIMVPVTNTVTNERLLTH